MTPLRRAFLGVWAASAIPSRLSACAVCYGKSDNADTAAAFLWGGGLLLGCTFGLLAFFIAVIWRGARRQARGQAA